MIERLVPRVIDQNIFHFQAWTYHPMLNISVIPQRKYNLAPSVINKLYNPAGAKVIPGSCSLVSDLLL